MTGVAVNVTDVPVQMLVAEEEMLTAGVTEPAMDTWATEEVAVVQTPFCTMARKYVVAVSAAVEYGLFVEAMSFTSDAKLSDEYCHFVIEPVLPDRPIELALPLHTDAGVGVAVPPTLVSYTVNVALVVMFEHGPSLDWIAAIE